MKVHLVDGTYELFRAHFGAPPAVAPDGSPVGAVRGLARTLLAQFLLAEDLTRALGVVTWPMVEMEADDALATAAARFAQTPGVEQVVICSPDKDLAQCVRGDKVICLDRRQRKVLDEAGVRAKFGVLPESMPDWLALVGDTADGYPGVPRWGGKSAAAVLSVYRRLERIPDYERHWEVEVRGAAALGASLREHRQQAALFRVLATLRTDAPLAETLEDLRWRGAHRDALPDLCARIGEDEVVPRMTLWRPA